MRQTEPATRRRGMMVQIQQISTWQSSFGSEMGDPTPSQQQMGGLDETILTTMITQYQQLVFKKLYTLVRRFHIQMTLPVIQARTMSPVGSAASLIHLGASAADYSGKEKAPAWEEGPSPSAMDGQQTEHEGRDLTKKMSPSTAKADKDRGCSKEGSRSQGASRQPSDKESDKE